MGSARVADVAGDLSSQRVHVVGQLGLGQPLTERILGRLGPHRWFWIAAWASMAIVAPAVLWPHSA